MQRMQWTKLQPNVRLSQGMKRLNVAYDICVGLYTINSLVVAFLWLKYNQKFGPRNAPIPMDASNNEQASMERRLSSFTFKLIKLTL